MKLRLLAPLFLSLFALCACDSTQTEGSYSSKTKDDLYKNGSIVGDKGGYSLLGGPGNKNAENVGLAVNGFLWRAALDTIAFMPIAAADPFGGILTTDWYSPPATPNERTKLNVFILDRDLRADGVRVSVFRQTRNPDNTWTDATVAPATATQLEDLILTRARQLKLAQKEVAP